MQKLVGADHKRQGFVIEAVEVCGVHNKVVRAHERQHRTAQHQMSVGPHKRYHHSHNGPIQAQALGVALTWEQ